MKHILHESVWVKTQAKHTEEIGNSIIFIPLVPPPHDTLFWKSDLILVSTNS